MSKSPWSESLQEQTREAIAEIRVSPNGQLHFKHKTLGYRVITFEDLATGVLLLRPEKMGVKQSFTDAESLLDAGWAID